MSTKTFLYVYFFVNAPAKSTHMKRDCHGYNWKQVSGFQVWEEKAMVQSGRSPQQKAAFLKSKLCSGLLALKD